MNSLYSAPADVPSPESVTTPDARWHLVADTTDTINRDFLTDIITLTTMGDARLRPGDSKFVLHGGYGMYVWTDHIAAVDAGTVLIIPRSTDATALTTRLTRFNDLNEELMAWLESISE